MKEMKANLSGKDPLQYVDEGWDVLSEEECMNGYSFIKPTRTGQEKKSEHKKKQCTLNAMIIFTSGVFQLTAVLA